MARLKITPEWLDARVTGRPIGVDRDNAILRGYVVAQAGPFKSEGRGEFDRAGLGLIVQLGNAKQGGLKSRFTHPSLSSDGLGKFLGRAKNLSMATAKDARTGKLVDAVRADLHFDKTALDTPPEGGKPLGVYVMDLAESDPDALSSSIVLKLEEKYRLNEDGTPQTDEDGNDLPPLWIPKELHASDIVDTGDAVDGVLSIDSLPDAAVRRGAEMLDAVFAGCSREVIKARAGAWLDRYLNLKFGEPEPDPSADILRRRLALKKLAG